MGSVLMVAFVITLIGVAVSDIKKRVIPGGLILIIGIIAVMAMVFQDDLSFTNRLLGFFCISAPLLMIPLFVPYTSGALGGGDIKLMAVSGFYLGSQLILLSFLLGVMTAGVYGLWLLLMKKKGRKDHFALGPFLCAGMMVALFFGTSILDGISNRW